MIDIFKYKNDKKWYTYCIPTYYWKSNITIGGSPGALLKIQRQKQTNKLLYVDKIYTVIISVCLIVCPTPGTPGTALLQLLVLKF